jgi:hypothetical protein
VLLPKGLRYQVRWHFLGCFLPPTRFHLREGRGLSFFRVRVQPDGAIQRDGTDASAVTNPSSQVNTLPNAKSQAKDKRAKDRQKYAESRCKVGVAPPGF